MFSSNVGPILTDETDVLSKKYSMYGTNNPFFSTILVGFESSTPKALTITILYSFSFLN